MRHTMHKFVDIVGRTDGLRKDVNCNVNSRGLSRQIPSLACRLNDMYPTRNVLLWFVFRTLVAVSLPGPETHHSIDERERFTKSGIDIAWIIR